MLTAKYQPFHDKNKEEKAYNQFQFQNHLNNITTHDIWDKKLRNNPNFKEREQLLKEIPDLNLVLVWLSLVTSNVNWSAKQLQFLALEIPSLDVNSVNLILEHENLTTSLLIKIGDFYLKELTFEKEKEGANYTKLYKLKPFQESENPKVKVIGQILTEVLKEKDFKTSHKKYHEAVNALFEGENSQEKLETFMTLYEDGNITSLNSLLEATLSLL